MFGLDVAVDRVLVGILQRDAQLVHDAQHLGQREPLAGRQLLQHAAQRVALHVLHGDVHALARAADVMHAHDVGMGQLPRDARLVEKALHHHLVAQKLGQQRLQRHILAQHVVVNLVNAAHPAAADQVEHRKPAIDHLAPRKLHVVGARRRGRSPDAAAATESEHAAAASCTWRIAPAPPDLQTSIWGTVPWTSDPLSPALKT